MRAIVHVPCTTNLQDKPVLQLQQNISYRQATGRSSDTAGGWVRVLVTSGVVTVQAALEQGITATNC